jgi:hypothetical protein
MPGTSNDQSSIEKRNRKRRAAKPTTPERIMPKVVIDSYIEEFYAKFMTKKKKFNCDSS